jgi:Zn-dependent protease/predicted transcriptional regulator
MFERRVTLFKLFGFEVRIDISWLILAVLIVWSLAKGFFPYYYPNLPSGIYWWMGAFGALGLFASIILHELSHALVAQRYGLPMRGITLFIFGGIAEMDDEPPTPRAEFLMALAGPVASVAISLLFLGSFTVGKQGIWPLPLNGVFYYLAWINALLAGFNLLPAFPLDGGRVLRSILWSSRDNFHWATRISSQIGAGFGTALIVLGLFSVITGNLIGGVWWFLIGMFLRNASTTSYRQMVIRQGLAGEQARALMSPQVVTVPPSVPVDRLVEDFFYKYSFTMFPVVQDEKLVGCVNTQTVKQYPRDEWSRHTVGEIVRECDAETTIRPDTNVSTILATMNRTRQNRLMVVEGDHLLGVVTIKAMLNHLALKWDLEGEEENLKKILEEEVEE